MILSTRVPGALAAIALAAAALLSQAQAAPALSVSLTPATSVAIGGAVTVDVFVSGLTQAIGGYSFDLTYDTSRMLFGSFLADPDTKMGDLLNPALDLSLGNTGLHVDFTVLAGFFAAADEATLAALQGPGFRLGTASFTAGPNSGFASFGLSGYSLSDYSGLNDIADVTASGARLCVLPVGANDCNGGNNDVPEPATALLLAAAFGGLVASRRKQSAAR